MSVTIGQRVLLCSVLLAGAGTAGAQRHTDHPSPTRPGQAPRADSADIAFMQGMIGHHAQALVMSAMVQTRTENTALRMLAQRIAVSQRDEIEQMQRWLREHGVPPVDVDSTWPARGGGHAGHSGHAGHAGHAGHGTGMDHARMPGMLTPAQLDTLQAARGRDFERHFLAYMIAHHEGAIVMVRALFASPGGGQAADIFQFAADVEADQSAEVARMRRMLARYGDAAGDNPSDNEE